MTPDETKQLAIATIAAEGLKRGYDAYHKTPCRLCGCYAGDHLMRLNPWASKPVLGKCDRMRGECRCPGFRRQG